MPPNYFKHIIAFRLCLLILLLSISACNVTKYVPEGRSLHNTTQVNLLSKKKIKDKSELKLAMWNLTRPLPNDRMLGMFKFKLWVYNGTKNAEKGLSNWMLRNLGQPPVLVDSIMLGRSASILKDYLFSKGYFYNSVGYRTLTKNKLSTVIYDVKVEEPYRINQIFFPTDSLPIQDTIITNTPPQRQAVYEIIDTEKKKTVLKSGQQFDVEKLREERDRVTYLLRNKGYFNFTNRHVQYKLDSSQNKQALDVFLNIKTPTDSTEHETFHIRNVYIHPQFYPKQDSSFYTDTLLIDGYHYITPANKRLRPNTITRFLLIKKGHLYSQKNYEYAINHLLELGVFKFVNIRYEPIKEGNKNLLDCYIYLTPNKKMAVTAELGLNNYDRNSVASALLGTSASLTYTNKNIFKGAEAFSINLYGGLEFNIRRDTINSFNDNLINTGETRGEVKLRFPKFLLPFKINNLSRYYRPKTDISLSLDYIRRLGLYTLTSSNAALSYDWRENSRKRHILTPISLSLLSLLGSEAVFEEQLENNAVLAQSFQERVILGTTYSYIYSNQAINQFRNFVFFRGNVDLVGNSTYLFDRFLQATNLSDKPLKIAGNKYAQYLRLDVDFRHYNYFGKHQSLVSRVATGIGVPYGNSDVLPYIKQFFVGGSHSVRAFDIRSIGPGAVSSSDTTINEFDRTGDLKFEANLEYRFNIWSYFKGAIFTDIGNVWTINAGSEELATNEAGRFRFKNFFSELGIGVGAGFRMDFSYFVIRFDMATPIRRPDLPPAERWVIRKMQLGDKNWRSENLAFRVALGYPF